jgi:hypothetical protein
MVPRKSRTIHFSKESTGATSDNNRLLSYLTKNWKAKKTQGTSMTLRRLTNGMRSTEIPRDTIEGDKGTFIGLVTHIRRGIRDKCWTVSKDFWRKSNRSRYRRAREGTLKRK